MIIDDEWMVRHFIEDVALTQDIDVSGTADSWESAEEILDSETVDFAIVDIEIKGNIDGIGVARRLKERNIPFLFLTAYKDIATIKEAAELSPISYLIKPVTSENLIAALLLAMQKLEKPEAIKQIYTIDEDGLIYKQNVMMELSKHERAAFALLLKNRWHAVGYSAFFHTLWENPDEINEGSLRNIVAKLRKKLPDARIENIKDLGYKLF